MAWCYGVLQRHTFCSTVYDMLRSVRFPEELDALLVEAAARDDRSLSYLVIKAVEQALGAPAPRADAAPPPRGDAEAGPIPVPASAVPSKPVRRPVVPSLPAGTMRGSQVLQNGREGYVVRCYCGALLWGGMECEEHGPWELTVLGRAGEKGVPVPKGKNPKPGWVPDVEVDDEPF